MKKHWWVELLFLLKTGRKIKSEKVSLPFYFPTKPVQLKVLPKHHTNDPYTCIQEGLFPFCFRRSCWSVNILPSVGFNSTAMVVDSIANIKQCECYYKYKSGSPKLDGFYIFHCGFWFSKAIANFFYWVEYLTTQIRSYVQLLQLTMQPQKTLYYLR